MREWTEAKAGEVINLDRALVRNSLVTFRVAIDEFFEVVRAERYIAGNCGRNVAVQNLLDDTGFVVLFADGVATAASTGLGDGRLHRGHHGKRMMERRKSARSRLIGNHCWNLIRK